MKKVSLILVCLVAMFGFVQAAAALDVLIIPIDIKPCKDPNVLNVKAGGILPVAVPADVDPATILLEGVSPLTWTYKYGNLLVKFNAQAVIAALGPVQNGEAVTLTLTGVLDDGVTYVMGTDDVVIVKRGK